MGGITALELLNFSLFEHFFSLIKDYTSWFIGISFGFVFSRTIGFFKKGIGELKIAARFTAQREEFIFFILNLAIMAILSTVIKEIAITFFNTFFIYFHVIFLQWILLIYLFFKLTNKYEISAKYFLTNEIIVVVYTAIILLRVA